MSRERLLKILDLARWAPSGDNTQPWRFEIVSDSHIAVHGFDTRDHVVYDFDGHASHMAHGALLETLRLAATRFSMKTDWSIRPGLPDTAPIYDVTLEAAEVPEDPLASCIEARCVQRRAMHTAPLSAETKNALVAAVGDEYSLQFFESFPQRLSVARLLWKNAGIRLTCPEAYPVHRDIIEWNSRYSNDRIPDQAVGVDPLTTMLMRWVMKSWNRVDFFNRFLGGTIIPRIQLDLIPALACASHVLLVPKKPPCSLEGFVNAGTAVQRLWLTATKHGLHLQPEMTPVIFRWYVQDSRKISSLESLNQSAVTLCEGFEQLAKADRSTAFSFFCRTGYGTPPSSRSLRRSVIELTNNTNTQ